MIPLRQPPSPPLTGGGREGAALHPLRHLYAEQSHAVLDGLSDIGGNDEAQHLLLLGIGVED